MRNRRLTVAACALLVLALGSAVVLLVVGLRAAPPSLPAWWKTGLSLILTAAAIALLQVRSGRTRRERLLGLNLAAAFLLWGIEQYLTRPGLAVLFDGVVVILFVLDAVILAFAALPGSRPQAGS